jgi:hypothetical protein
MPQLTELCIKIDRFAVPPLTTAACTALTVRTNLCSLQLGIIEFPGTTVPAGCDLFTPGTVYPHLRRINLCYDGGQQLPFTKMPVSKQQLQQLCSCCPSVENLAISPSQGFSAAAFSPLLQLSYLAAAAALPIALGVAAQLTRLKQLTLSGVPQLTDPVLLEELNLAATAEGLVAPTLSWKNTVRDWQYATVWCATLAVVTSSAFGTGSALAMACHQDADDCGMVQVTMHSLRLQDRQVHDTPNLADELQVVQCKRPIRSHLLFHVFSVRYLSH